MSDVRTAAHRRWLALAVLAGAVVAYLLAAWAVPPGFFDGLTPPAPYRWNSTPPGVPEGGGPPLAGSTSIALGANGSAPPGTAFTADGQATISWTAGAFKAPRGQRRLVLRLTPVRSFPAPGSLQLSTNAYCITSTAPIANGRNVLVSLAYSDALATPPSDIYGATQGAGWRALSTQSSPQPFTISAETSTLGCFVAGRGTPPAPRYEQPMSLLVGGLLLLVLLGGGGLLAVRRRLRTRAAR
ncbi:MAG: hypothetical protein WAM30_14405 [Candidatus Dormiibacterota bacterium]